MTTTIATSIATTMKNTAIITAGTHGRSAPGVIIGKSATNVTGIGNTLMKNNAGLIGAGGMSIPITTVRAKKA